MLRAAMFYGPNHLSVEDVEIEALQDGELLIQIEAALTCGTDVKTYRRGHPVLFSRLPSRFGHEFAGTVVEAGSRVQNFQKGDRVVAVNSSPCYQCIFCKRGMYSMCQNLTFLNGAYAEYIVVPRKIVEVNTYVIPRDISFEYAAMAEPLSCVVHGMEYTNLNLGDTVVVLGAGPIGLYFVMLAKLRGATVISVDLSKHRLDVATACGADHVIESSNLETSQRAIFELTDALGADVVIEAVGIPETWEQAISYVRPGGTVIFFGGTKAQSKVAIDANAVHYKQLTLSGVFHHTPEMVRRAVNLIFNKKINVAPLISGEFPLEQVENAINLMGSQRGLKYVVHPQP